MNPIARLLRLPMGYAHEAEADGLSDADLARVSSFGFGATALATSFTIVVLPTRILDVAPEGSKNTYLGVLSFVGMVIAVVVQPVIGGVSDRITTRWGNRAPFIIGGAIAAAPLIVAAGAAPSYVLLFVFICALQVFSNSALGPYNGLIRDLVPHGQRGAASGMKIMLETAGAMIVTAVVGVFMGRYQDTDNFAWIWSSVGLLAALMLAGALWTGAGIGKVRRVIDRAKAIEPEAGPNTGAGYKMFLASRFVLVFAAASIATFALFFLEDVVGIDNPAGQLWKMILAVGGMVLLVAFPAGLLSDRIGRKPIMMLGGAFAVLGTVLLLLSESLGMVIAAGVVVGLATGMFLGSSWAMATDLVSRRRAAQQLGYLNLAMAGAAGLARLNGLWVDRLNGESGDLGYTVLLIGCGALFGVGTLMILAIRSTDRALERAG